MLEEQQEALAPFYATAILLVINQILPQHRMGWQQFDRFPGGGRPLAGRARSLAARRRISDRRHADDRPRRHACERSCLSRRRRAAHAAGHGCDHEFHLRPRADRHRLLHLPCDRAGAAADQGRPRSARDPHVRFVLGHGVVHHAAGCARGLRRGADRQNQPDARSASRRCALEPRSTSFHSVSCSIRLCCCKGNPTVVAISVVFAFARHLRSRPLLCRAM